MTAAKTASAPEVPPTPEAVAEVRRGSIVLYSPLAYEARNADAGPWPGIVTNVGPLPGQVTLNVQLPVPTMIGGDPVARRTEVPYSATPEPGTWGWM